MKATAIHGAGVTETAHAPRTAPQTESATGRISCAALRICLAHPNPGPECETFIRAHIRGLSGVQSVLHGGHMPLRDAADNALHPGLPQDSPLLFSPSGKAETQEHRQAAMNMARFLRSGHTDVVLAQYGPTGVALLPACREANIPLVAHFHGYDASLGPVLAKYAAGYAALFEHVAAVIAVSQEMRQDLLRLGAPEDRLYVIPYGVDASMFTAASPQDAPPRFVSVGRFVDKKAPETVLAAFAAVQADIPDATLVMLGDGVLRPACIRLAACLGVAHAVSFPGAVSHDEVAQVMRGARCFVQHSVTAPTGDKEGTPNAVLEAAASGLPVVATYHAGIREAVVHEHTGLLCHEHDAATMAEHMRRMARSPALAAALGAAGRAHVQACYDRERQLAALTQVLQAAVQETPR